MPHQIFGPINGSSKIPKEQVRDRLHPQMFASVTILCTCVSPHPLVVPLIPGTNAGATCATCGKIWRVSKLTYTREPKADGAPEETCNMGFDVVEPAIVRPGTLPAGT